MLDWYQSDEQPERAPLDILRDIVEDLQSDRKAALEASGVIRTLQAEKAELQKRLDQALESRSPY